MVNAMGWLAQQWHAAGVNAGDLLLVHSSLKRTLLRLEAAGYEPSPVAILESFLEAIGKDGTLVLPLFNFDFTRGEAFDIRSTPSHMGALTEAGRKHPSAVRTGHPIYSFAAIGKDAHLFKGVNNVSGYGSDSPFGIIHRMNGKIAVLDLPDQHSMTFYHYIEEQKEVSYRYFKNFTSEYIDEHGIKSDRTYKLFVRDIEKGISTHVNPMGEILWVNGIYSGEKPNEGCGLRTISANSIFNEVSKIIDEGKAEGTLYSINK